MNTKRTERRPNTTDEEKLELLELYRFVEDAENFDEKTKAEIMNHLCRLPEFVRNNGLGQVLAFYRANLSSPYKEYEYILRRVCLLLPPSAQASFGPKRDTMDVILSQSLDWYKLASRKITKNINLLKLFAEGRGGNPSVSRRK